MLPELTLDNESFEEIMDEARNMIISLYPEWTDFNYHDPGITLIELFSWMKESQLFFLDQISSESRERYLKLLGVKRGHKKPARALVSVEAPEDVTVLRGTRLYAGKTCFQAVEKTRLIGGDIAKCFYADQQGIAGLANRGDMGVGRRLGLELFGAATGEGAFYMKFERPLPQDETLGVFLELYEDRLGRRNPIGDGLAFPLAVMEMQYFGEEGWTPVCEFCDGTNGAIVTGRVSFAVPGPMRAAGVWGEEGYFLRFILSIPSCDGAPILQSISVNTVLVEQTEQLIECLELPAEIGEDGAYCCLTDTMMSLNGKNEIYGRTAQRYIWINRFTKKSNFDTGSSVFCFQLPDTEEELLEVRVVSWMEKDGGRRLLAEGTGFPFQEYDLGDVDVSWDTFELMVRDVRGGPQDYQAWTRVESFAESGPEDLHFMLDAAGGTVRFGDCIRGMAPEGDIVVVSCGRTLGRQGNAQAFAIDRFDGLEPEAVRVCNRQDCQGGVDEETLEECFLRARRELKHPITAVSDEDYERRVMETPGLMLDSCRVISSAEMKQMKNIVDETEIHIVVKPFYTASGGGLSQAYKNNILSYLERFRMAGRKISLLFPQYIAFEIYGDIVLHPHFVGARELVERTVEDYFARLGSQFGGVVQYTDFYGAVDILDCVADINSLTIDAKGNGITRSKDGTVKLPPNGVVRLGTARYLFSVGE